MLIFGNLIIAGFLKHINFSRQSHMTDKTSSCKQAYVSKTFIITSYGSGKLISYINLSLFPFEVGCHFSFEGTKNPNTKGFFVLNLIIIGPVILKS